MRIRMTTLALSNGEGRIELTALACVPIDFGVALDGLSIQTRCADKEFTRVTERVSPAGSGLTQNPSKLATKARSQSAFLEGWRSSCFGSVSRYLRGKFLHKSYRFHQSVNH